MLDANDSKYPAVDDRYAMWGRYFILSWRDFVKEEWEKIDQDELRILYEEINKRHKIQDLLSRLKAFFLLTRNDFLNDIRNPH